jgi:hypothetical protein
MQIPQYAIPHYPPKPIDHEKEIQQEQNEEDSRIRFMFVDTLMRTLEDMHYGEGQNDSVLYLGSDPQSFSLFLQREQLNLLTNYTIRVEYNYNDQHQNQDDQLNQSQSDQRNKHSQTPRLEYPNGTILRGSHLYRALFQNAQVEEVIQNLTEQQMESMNYMFGHLEN